MYNFGVLAAIYLVVHIVSLIVTWWAIQSFKVDLFLKDPKGARAKTLLILVTIAISYLVAEFFLNYINQSTLLSKISG
ncbi:DUF1146 family protein [Camelliibacillus cellulosilyticus]|uniref:DUF1146 family protein n=1 Tax=Camelliibacillus cellulosilyticus TaxID=2174486 RepID=A0ABV9GNP1_9BACL